MLSEKEIEKIAELARIKLTADEKHRFQKELSVILDYIDQLNKVSTDKVEPLYQTTGLVNSVREDKQRDVFLPEKSLEKLINQAPHRKERFIKVKSVLKK